MSRGNRKKVCGKTVKKKKSYKNTFILRKLDPQINTCMPCIVSRALMLFTTPKDKRLSKCNLSAYCCLKSTKKGKIYTFFELKWLNWIHKKLGTFSLFALFSSDNLVHIPFQVGTFCAHYTTQNN